MFIIVNLAQGPNFYLPKRGSQHPTNKDKEKDKIKGNDYDYSIKN